MLVLFFFRCPLSKLLRRSSKILETEVGRAHSASAGRLFEHVGRHLLGTKAHLVAPWIYDGMGLLYHASKSRPAFTYFQHTRHKEILTTIRARAGKV